MPLVELRQDRSLVRANFDGYKLSLDPVPILRQELQTSAPIKFGPASEQYSLLHAEVFALQNLLQADPWERTICYYVDNQHSVMCSFYDENAGRAKSLQSVYRIDTNLSGERRAGDYNYSLRFISEKYCVLCDGIKTLFLLDTGDRLKLHEWKLVASTPIDSSTTDPKRGFILYDARLDMIQTRKRISVALGHVARSENEDSGVWQHYMQIFWARWTNSENTWHYEVCETLEGKGSIHYCAFEPRAESLVVSSNRELLMQAQKLELEARREMSVEKDKQQHPHLHNGTDEADAAYSWTQNDDIVIKFALQPRSERNDYNIKCDGASLNVKYLAESLLEGTLHAAIDNDLTTWTIENDFLQLTLVKKTTGEHWTHLLKDGAGPKESLDDIQPSTVGMEHNQPILNLETPIEDCDFPMDAMAQDDNAIVRFHLPDKSVTHTVLLGDTPPLFATNLRAGFPNALATRQDVNASVWLQQFNPSKPLEWSLRHEGNLHAFGYVQASKQQRKFIDCAPDLSYAIICESHRHVFLYKAKYDSANGLRNRHGPQVTIGKQHLITLDDSVGEVLGMCTALNVVTLLTEKELLHLQIQ